MTRDGLPRSSASSEQTSADSPMPDRASRARHTSRRRLISAAAVTGLVAATASLATDALRPAAAEAAQVGWKSCRKCQTLYWPNTTYPVGCTTGGLHDPTGSYAYTVRVPADGGPGQDDWRSCANCHTLWWSGGYSGRCLHDGLGHRISNPTYPKTWYYRVETETAQPSGVRYQLGWRSCVNCLSLFYSPAATSAGRCPNGGGHLATGSYNYLLRY